MQQFAARKKEMETAELKSVIYKMMCCGNQKNCAGIVTSFSFPKYINYNISGYQRQHLIIFVSISAHESHGSGVQTSNVKTAGIHIKLNNNRKHSPNLY